MIISWMISTIQDPNGFRPADMDSWSKQIIIIICSARLEVYRVVLKNFVSRTQFLHKNIQHSLVWVAHNIGYFREFLTSAFHAKSWILLTISVVLTFLGSPGRCLFWMLVRPRLNLATQCFTLPYDPINFVFHQNIMELLRRLNKKKRNYNSTKHHFFPLLKGHIYSGSY